MSKEIHVLCDHNAFYTAIPGRHSAEFVNLTWYDRQGAMKSYICRGNECLAIKHNGEVDSLPDSLSKP